MKLFYCKSWFRAKKCPTEVWSEAQAKAAHEGGKTYTVLVGSIEQPYCFVEVTEKAVGVGFLDEHLRESLSYAFQEVEPGRLFLTMATYREFEGDMDRVTSGTSYIFGQDGVVVTRREFFNPHKLEKATSNSDVAANYSPKPKFGHYGDLIRVERE
jgi:hypothetical protein